MNQRLNELKDDLIDEFELRYVSAAKWKRYRNEFINKVTSVSGEICDDETGNNSESKSSFSNNAAVLLVYAANNTSGQNKMASSLRGLSVSVGK